MLLYRRQDKCGRNDKEDVATADIMDTSTGLVPIKISIPNYAGKYESAEALRNLQIQRENRERVLSLTVKHRILK